MNNNWFAKLRLRKMVGVTLSLVMLVGVLAACSGGSEKAAEKTVLRIGVMYGGSDNEPYMRQQYTDMFEMMNPNVTFEIVGAINYDDQRFETQDSTKPVTDQPDTYEKVKELLTGQNPVDVMIFDYNLLRRLTQDNLLQQLDPLIQQDKFDLTDYVSTVIDGIKAAGDNNIYALTPTFSSSALFYNKKLFTDAGVTPPTDKMQWSEILSLARQVAKGEGEARNFGFSFNRYSNDGFSDTQTYAQALQLKMWDDKAEKMLVNSDQWAEVWQTVADLYNEKIVPTQEFIQQMNEKVSAEGGNDPFYGDLFIKGRVAMTIGEYYYINELKKAADNATKIKDFVPVDWDVVTVPTFPGNPEVGGNIYLSSLMGINAKAQNPDGAWDFIKFSNGKEWAKLKSRSLYEMVARKEFLTPIGGLQYNMDAFTTLKPLPPLSSDQEKIYREKPGIWEAQSPGYELFQKVLTGDMTVKEALAEWETRGNATLEKLKTDPTGGMDDGGGIVKPFG
ncbi:ABC transporter substrate-binding protein [Paenibacillus harenae]|uniref:ABC transporter substrate-binding protein n=1 Tax=Paenibacillus harenae TaxID=306543 RepID=UPI002794FB99|nr:extracellular solute-binding protein [Paenibacillus harenae]MDQ0059439.1 multiple sugar transport system substrate-binding protein [Paenibacillus harenae]